MALDDGFISRLFQLESSNDPEAVTGNNRGLGQFGPREEARYGITDWKNYGQQAAAVRREMAEFGPALSRSLGRDPTPGELYLAHQQGLKGATTHFANPDGTAWRNVRQYYPSDKVARDAVWNNIPDNARISPNFNKTMFPGGVDDVTSKHFTDGWIGKFEGTPALPISGGLPGGGMTASAPVGSVPAGATASEGVPSTAGLLAGTDVMPGSSPSTGSTDIGQMLGRMSNIMQPQQMQPAQFSPMPIAMPANVTPAMLRLAALRGMR